MKLFLAIVFSCAFIGWFAESAPIIQNATLELTTKYLILNGYLNSSDPLTESLLKDALQNFQSDIELPITENETISAMSKLRSSVPEKNLRYSFFGRPRKKSHLTYFLLNYPKKTINLSNSDVDRIVAESFNDWASVVNLDFSAADSKAKCDIPIVFYNITQFGKLGFYSGTIHVNNNLIWDGRWHKGLLLRYVLTHEIGHALGLGHSTTFSVMNNNILFSIDHPSFLGTDDIAGIQKLYGGKNMGNYTYTIEPVITLGSKGSALPNKPPVTTSKKFFTTLKKTATTYKPSTKQATNKKTTATNLKITVTTKKSFVTHLKITVTTKKPFVTNLKITVTTKKPFVTNLKITVTSKKPFVTNSKTSVTSQKFTTKKRLP